MAACTVNLAENTRCTGITREPRQPAYGKPYWPRGRRRMRRVWAAKREKGGSPEYGSTRKRRGTAPKNAVVAETPKI